jgi:hypothetical protein
VKYLKNTALLSVLAVLCSLSAFARDKNQHSVNISDAVQIGATQLQPGNYKVEWQGTGPDVQVTFLQNGRTVATVPGTLKTNDAQVSQDAIVTDNASANKKLNEIDFAHDKQALIFQSGM